MRHVAHALVASARGDATAWADLLADLRREGLLRPGDPDRPDMMADAGAVAGRYARTRLADADGDDVDATTKM
jgi:hypothetical protein